MFPSTIARVYKILGHHKEVEKYLEKLREAYPVPR